jgi:hypothetical protein
MAVHNCGFSGQILHTELIMLSVAFTNEDILIECQVQTVHEQGLEGFKIKTGSKVVR